MSDDGMDRRSGAAAGSVALFVDWDNFAIGLRQEMPDRPADVGPILRWSRRFGLLTVCRAYGEWRDPSERLAIYNAGVEVVYAPVLPLGGSLLARNGGGAKSLADTAMAVDVTELLSLIPTVSTVILATSDKDMIPVLRFAQRRGLQAIVVGSDRTAGALKELADRFISYRELLDTEGATAAPQLSRPATVPPVRYPRATRPGAAAGLPVPAGATPATGVRAPRQQPLLVGPGRGVPVPTEAPTRPLTTAGSVFATGEDEVEAEPAAAARRRRRGGRRRRGAAAAAEPGLAAVTEEPTEEVTSEEGLPTPTSERFRAAEAAEQPMAAAEQPAGAAPAEAVAAAGAREPAPGPTDEEERPAVPEGAQREQAPSPAATMAGPTPPPTVPQPSPAAVVAPVVRTPVVLPGERLRRFRAAEAVAEPPAAEAEAPTTPQVPAAGTDGATTRPGAVEAEPAVDATAVGVAAEDAGAMAAVPAGPGGASTEGEQPAPPRRRTAGRSRGGRKSGQAGTDRSIPGEAEASTAAPTNPALEAAGAAAPVVTPAEDVGGTPTVGATDGVITDGVAPAAAEATETPREEAEAAAGAERQASAPTRSRSRRRGERSK